jgi:hypothetical protein
MLTDDADYRQITQCPDSRSLSRNWLGELKRVILPKKTNVYKKKVNHFKLSTSKKHVLFI